MCEVAPRTQESQGGEDEDEDIERMNSSSLAVRTGAKWGNHCSIVPHSWTSTCSSSSQTAVTSISVHGFTQRTTSSGIFRHGDSSTKPTALTISSALTVKHKRRYCRAPGCSRIVKSQGLCQRHGAKPRSCRIEGCGSQAQGNFNGMCKRHFRLLRSTPPRKKIDRNCRGIVRTDMKETNNMMANENLRGKISKELGIMEDDCCDNETTIGQLQTSSQSTFVTATLHHQKTDVDGKDINENADAIPIDMLHGNINVCHGVWDDLNFNTGHATIVTMNSFVESLDPEQFDPSWYR